MLWSKPFVNILLFLVSVSIVKCSSTNRVENNTAWLRKYLNEIGEKPQHETNKIKPTPQIFAGSTNGLVLSSEAERQKLENDKRRLHSNPVGVAPKEHHINNGIKPHRTNIPFSKTPELNYPGKQRWNIVSANRHVKQTSLRSVIINRKLSKNEANFREFSNPGKEINKKMVSRHRIAKRNVYLNETKQARITASTFITPPACTGKRSCSGRCTENITEWRTDESFTCYCDTACYEIFNDCCSDYTKYCGEQKRSNISIKKFKWTCEPLGNFRLTISRTRKCEIGEGLWMVSQCADDWPYDKIQRKCENPAKFIRKASNIKRYIPAVSENVIFRNYFCVRCNRIVGPLEYFPVEIETNVFSPETYSFRKKLNFLLSYGAKFPQKGLLRPKPYQKRRYCLKSVIDSCPGNITSEPCTNGSVELISGRKSFKNYNCALCNDPDGQYACFPSFSTSGCRRFSSSETFLLNLNYRNVYYPNRSPLSVLNTLCRSKGLVFDVKLQECVDDIPPPSGNESRIRVLAWFVPSTNFQFTENDFKTAMKQYFGVEHSQLYNVSIDAVPKSFWSDRSLSSRTLLNLVRATIHFTPEQIFDILFETDSNSSSFNLRSFIHFKKPLSLTFNNITYTIIKTTSRPLSCNTRINGYTLRLYRMGDQEAIKIIPTYEKVEYDKQIYGNITMCEEHYPRPCNTTQTGLTKKDFAINADLSLYHRDSGMLYKFGQYRVLLNNSITLCKPKLSDIPTCSSENSCKGRCSNQTEWRTEIKLRCSCDPDCYEVFNDCCSDYTKYCRAQKPTETPTKKYNYTCEKIGHHIGAFSKYCLVGDGLWIVTRCLRNWPYDNFRTKCEAPLDNLDMSSPDLYAYLPVLGHDNTTFRNMYCAICNGVKKFEPWPLYTITSVTPPEYYNLTEKIHFLLSSGAEFRLWSPGKNQARRHCVRDVIESCPPGVKFQSTLISNVMNGCIFKNSHCAACRGIPREAFLCFRHFIRTGNCVIMHAPRSFSLVLDHSQVKTEIKERVSKYEKEGGGSRIDPIGENEQMPKRFYIYSWLEPPRNSQNISFTPTEFYESLEKYLNASQLQLFDINITTVLRPETMTSFFYIVSSTIILTPQQSSELLHTNRNKNISTEAKLLNYIYFSKPFTLHIKGIPYTVTKATPRPLTCVETRTFTPEEYTVQDQEEVFIPRTNKTYKNFEYYWENAEQLKRGNISICEKYIPAKCNGSIVLYKPEEYSIMVNLSIYVKETSSLYSYGEYEILSNKSVAICQYFKVHLITETRQTILNNEVLGHITFVSFLLSILSLIFLLVTYILFPQLRTLPGKNLMNFSTNLLLFELFWLPSGFTEVWSDKPACMALGILEHYFLLSSFVGMSVIAFHTCKVFARRLPAPKMSERHERKLFCMYLASVWLLPGIFVGICVALDHQDVVKIGYGESEICWLTEDNAYTYFVIIPIAVLLLFNIIAFVIAAIYLRKHGQNTAARQASGNRRSNFLIYVKLSTLMGFTWLFGLLGLVVPSTTVFWYFFVIFTSLQGVFVAVAFVMNVKTFGLYKQWYSSGSRAPKANRPRRNVPMKVLNVKEL